ncbi:MAG: HEAT repeat domain-containing protein [Fuerstiella sp.]|nr:HEAT repeat domain-containing protein [Fuerstiella sp.]MCP4855474.1 HEAT repeat domain-containing protein [Fuerstiella sp.]
MYWKRSVQVFLLGSGLLVFGVGCSVVDAVFNSPAGNAASARSPQRMAAIGRMYENQGRLTWAQVMYRRALKAELGNKVVRERLAEIAVLKSQRSFNSTTLNTRKAIAVADSLKPRTQTRYAHPSTPETAEQLIVAVTEDAADITVDVSASVTDNVVESLASAATATEDDSANTLLAPDSPTSADSLTAALPASVDGASNEAAIRGLTFAPAASVHIAETHVVPESTSEVATIGYQGPGNLDVTTLSLAAEWTEAGRVVTVEQVASWMDTPKEFGDELFTALQYGENDGVKALAAVLLTEVSPNDEQINQTLERAAADGADLLKVTALDALAQRGAITNEGVDQLLEFLADGDSDLRSQAASSLRNCADTDWAAQCVEGLSELLSDEDASIVAMAASTLGDFGGDAVEVCDDLQRLAVEQTDPYVLEAVSVALQRITNGGQENTAFSLPPVEDSTSDLSQSELLPVVE